MRRAAAAVTIVGLALTGCAAPAAPTPSQEAPARATLLTEGAWIRTTEGATNPSMTALFLTVVNPGPRDVRLVRASCADAGVTEVHHMVSSGGRMVMEEAKDGLLVRAGSHTHLKPGGGHVMLMQLTKALPVGDRSTCSLSFDDGTTLEVSAMVKQFTEEEDHYHPTPSMSPTP